MAKKLMKIISNFWHKLFKPKETISFTKKEIEFILHHTLFPHV
jgi:hypothetical protein